MKELTTGNTYWIFYNNEWHPTKVISPYKPDNLYFRFLDGGMVECKRIKDENIIQLKFQDNDFWNKFAEDLENEFGECLISDPSADENNPLDYWLQDVTVADILDFVKKQLNYNNNEKI